MKSIYLLLLFWLSQLMGLAQVAGSQRHYCNTDEMWADMVRQDSSLLRQRQQMDAVISKLANDYAGQHPSAARSAGSMTVVPTVVYVVYDSLSANISMTQIQSQMDQLNQNFEPYGYKFCYARRNVSDSSWFAPQPGDSAGVFRIQSARSDVNEYSTDAQLKALSPLPASAYLRIFIVRSISPQGVLGYALLPGTYTQQDGIVIRSDVFGSSNTCPSCQLLSGYNLGASLTHEAGHYLGLYHTFQGGCSQPSTLAACQAYGDQVCDTPPTAGSFGCPNPAPVCNVTDTELINNYMDYTDDACKNAFTEGQKARMDYSVRGLRQLLVSPGNLIRTAVTCVDLGDHYADFYCANYNGCVNTPMTFASLGSPGFTYSWTFGDGTTAVGDTVSHSFSGTGQFSVSLTAVSTSLNINTATSTPVLITACAPIVCSVNKWDFEYGYLDFSSGNPIATNHPTEYPVPSFADFYDCFYRADTMGRALFHISPRAIRINQGQISGLLDSSFNFIDSTGSESYYTVVPVPDHSNTYCLITTDDYHAASNTDTLVYSIITGANGGVNIWPGKRKVSFPMPAGSPHSIVYYTVAIPGCDAHTFWIIVNFTNGTRFQVYQLDSSGTISYHQSYSLPGSINYYNRMVASPDGKKIAILCNLGGNSCSMCQLHFDKASGNINGWDTVYMGSCSAHYNAGFVCYSPNSRFIYQAEQCCYPQTIGTESLYQYDTYDRRPFAGVKLVRRFAVPGPWHSGFCNLGPDHKIYIGTGTMPTNLPNSYRMAVINYPDRLENGNNMVGYNPNGPDMRPQNSPYQLQMGYMGFYDRYDNYQAYDCGWHPDKPSPFSYIARGCLTYQFYGGECFGSQWDFGDTASGASNVSTLSSPVHIFSHAGIYPVRLVANGYTFIDTINISAPRVYLSATPVIPCPVPQANYSITTVQSGVNYSWTITHGTPATAQSRTDIDIQWNAGDTVGTITVVALDTVMGCYDTAFLTVHYHAITNASVNHISASICDGHSYQFAGRSLSTPGTYRDTTILAGGCMSITELALTVSPPPTVTWAGGTLTLPVGAGSIPLTGGTPAGGVYSGPGVSNDTFYTASLSIGSHTITYTYTDANGCTGSATRTFVITAIDELDIDAHIQLYPNPAASSLIAQSDLFRSSTIQVTMYDMTGRIIAAPVERTTDKATFDISSLSDGVYSIRFTVNGQEASKRFIKME